MADTIDGIATLLTTCATPMATKDDVPPAAVAEGDMLIANSTPDWSILSKGKASQVLTMNAGETAPEWKTPAAGGTHDMLSATHTDSLVGTVVRGDILIGNSTPKWSRLAIGAASYPIISDGKSLLYGRIDLSQAVAGALPYNNGGTGQTTYAKGDVVYASDADTLSKLTAGTTDQVLTIAGGVPAWGDRGQEPFIMLPVCDKANLTAVTAMTTNVCHAYYVGVAPFNVASIDFRVRVTAAATGAITWAEVAVYTGSLVLGGNATLTRVGYTNVSATYNTTGVKVTNVACTITPGTGVWVVFGSVAATTMYQIRAGLADEIQTGTKQTFTGRPSTTLNAACTIFSTSGVPGLVAALFK